MMSQSLTLSPETIFEYLKLACKVPSVIDEIVSLHIIKSAAAKAGLEVEPEELQQGADNMRFELQLRSADETWVWLQKHWLSLDDFEELVYCKILTAKLAQHLFADKVEPWFIEHQLDYMGAVMYEVVLDDEDLAMELFYAIQEGEMSFPEVAHQYIQDTEVRRTGGYRETVRRAEMKPEISAAVFAAKPPQVLKPIVTSKGIYLILIEELIKPPLDEALRFQILSDLFAKWVKQQIDEIEVVTPSISSSKAA